MFAEAGGNPPAPGAPPAPPPSAPQAAPPGGPCECSGDPPPLPGALPPEGGGERAAGDAVEAVRDCFANMTMPFSSPGQAAGHAGPKAPPSKTVERGRLAAGAGAAGAAGIEGLGSGRLRPSPTSSLSGDGGGAGSTLSTASRMRPADRPSFSGSGEGGDDAASSGAAGAAPDRSRLFSKLSRPLPDYTIFHIFSKYGNVESVRLQRDKRHAFVKFSLPDEAQAAIAGLNGSEILGEKLKVAVADLRRDSRKRPRLGPPLGRASPGVSRHLILHTCISPCGSRGHLLGYPRSPRTSSMACRAVRPCWGGSRPGRARRPGLVLKEGCIPPEAVKGRDPASGL